MVSIAFIVTSPISADLLLHGQLRALKSSGFHVTTICSPSSSLQEVAKREKVDVVGVSMEREISPLQDIKSITKLYRLLKVLRPDIVNASTPKAGLLGMLVAQWLDVPLRIYQQRGLRLETTSGAERQVLLWSEKTAAACAHDVVCNSHSLRDRCIELGIAPPEKLRVLGAGSSNGVDVCRFHPRKAGTMIQLAKLRQKLGLDHGPIIGYVGRLTRDKGVEELLQAFEHIAKDVKDVKLLLVGPLENGDAINPATRAILQSHPGIIVTGFVSDTAPYYQLMDILAFPSYREGFPNAPLEAAAVGIPVVGYRATGTVDAVVDGETGILVDVGDIEGLTANLERLLKDANARVALGMRGRQRAVEQFASEIVWKNWAQYYRGMLASRRDV